MKIFLLLIFLLTPAVGYATDLTVPEQVLIDGHEVFYVSSEHPEQRIWGLTKDEWKGELVFQGLNIVDMATTDRILDQGGYEMNPLLPIDSDSSDLEMGLVTVGIGAIHYLVTRYVIEPEWRTTWQWFSSGLKAVAIGHNLTVVEW